MTEERRNDGGGVETAEKRNGNDGTAMMVRAGRDEEGTEPTKRRECLHLPDDHALMGGTPQAG